MALLTLLISAALCMLLAFFDHLGCFALIWFVNNESDQRMR